MGVSAVADQITGNRYEVTVASTGYFAASSPMPSPMRKKRFAAITAAKRSMHPVLVLYLSLYRNI